MTRFISFLTLTLLLVGCCSQPDDSKQAGSYVAINQGQFIVDGEADYFVGTNFWYGAILASQGEGGNRERLEQELDALEAMGVDNLRILVGADGLPGVPTKIEPTLQIAPGEYNDEIFDGLDYLLSRLGERGMKAVLFLNNAWEWSGGFSQYLMWAGEAKAPIPLVDGYPAYMEYVAGFVTNPQAQALFADHVRYVVSRTNRYTGLKYTEDPAIFSWQICNEPRAFKAEHKEALYSWISDVAKLIRSLDKNHLISTGSEGAWGCETDWELAERIHAIPEVDYMTIHIWPYNWSWLKADDMASTIDEAIANTEEYINRHLDIAKRISKPVVIEEFGMPRDGMVYNLGTPTTFRDSYYAYIFSRIASSKAEGGLLAGCNFWGWGGYAEPEHEQWQRGDSYCGDPAQEAQGLNSVFVGDESTIDIITKANQNLK